MLCADDGAVVAGAAGAALPARSAGARAGTRRGVRQSGRPAVLGKVTRCSQLNCSVIMFYRRFGSLFSPAEAATQAGSRILSAILQPLPLLSNSL